MKTITYALSLVDRMTGLTEFERQHLKEVIPKAIKGDRNAEGYIARFQSGENALVVRLLLDAVWGIGVDEMESKLPKAQR